MLRQQRRSPSSLSSLWVAFRAGSRFVIRNSVLLAHSLGNLCICREKKTCTYVLIAVCESQLLVFSTRMAAFRSTLVKLMNCVMAFFCCVEYAGGILC
jgi:hypothetical protein